MPETLSIVIPCYNEAATIQQLLERVMEVDLGKWTKEVIVVDDGSHDETPNIIKTCAQKHAAIKLYRHEKNKGKSEAVRTGYQQARGELVVVQDADLEYDPQDFAQMLPLFRIPEVNVVFGSRRMLKKNKGSGAIPYWGAQITNFATNILYNARLTDQFTCYKMIRRSLLEKISLHSHGFAIDAELVVKLLRRKEQIYEVPITYNPRSREEGKKIKVRDGLEWIWQILKYRFGPVEK